MNPFSFFTNFVLRPARGVLLLPLLLDALSAQTTGGITGRVYDEGSGKSLQGAVVTVRGTNLTDYTDANGRFSLSPIGAGPVTLDIEYVGLDPLTREITVPAGGSTT